MMTRPEEFLHKLYARLGHKVTDVRSMERRCGFVLVASVNFGTEFDIYVKVVMKLFDLKNETNSRYAHYCNEVKTYLKFRYIMGVTPLLDFGLRDEFAYIVFMYNPVNEDNFQMETVRDLITYKNCNINDVVTYAYYLASFFDSITVVYPDFVHGDLKPENIVLYMGVPYIIDFETTSFCSEGAFPLTTLPYRAPELFADKCRGTTKSDVYSWGIVFYEMVEHVNFASGDTGEYDALTWHKHHQNPKTSIKEYGNNYGDSFLKIIARCLDNDETNRPVFSEIKEHLSIIMEESDPDSFATCNLHLNNLKTWTEILKLANFGYIDADYVFQQLLSMHEYEFAEEYFSNSKDNNHHHILSVLARAIKLDESGNYEESICTYSYLMSLENLSHSERHQILSNLALAYKHEKSFDDALEVFKVLLTTASPNEYDNTFSNYVGTYIEIGELEKAINLGERRAFISPNSYALWAVLAQAYIKTGNRAKADFAIDRVWTLSPYSSFWGIIMTEYETVFGGGRNA